MGKNTQEIALEAYIRKTGNDVCDCALFLFSCGFLGSSPDGIIYYEGRIVFRNGYRKAPMNLSILFTLSLSIAIVATPFWFLYSHFISYVCLLFSIHRHCHCLHTHTHVPHITLALTYVIAPCPLFTSIVMQNTPFRFKHSLCLLNNICHPGGKLF